jgi:hypothetical protein
MNKPLAYSRNLQFAICNGQFAIFLSTLALLLIFPLSGLALSEKSKSSDDELRKSLDGPSKDDIDRELFGPDEKSKPPKGKPKEQGRAGGEKTEADKGSDLEKQIEQELGTAAEKESDNPLLDVARRMFQAGEKIKTDAGPDTQRLQKQIVSDLDRLIDEARKSCGQCSSCSSNCKASSRASVVPSQPKTGSKPGDKPASTSSPRPPGSPPPRKPDAKEIQNALQAHWGELPEHVREQMLQSPIEQFVPEYEQLLEDYFHDLAEKKE